MLRVDGKPCEERNRKARGQSLVLRSFLNPPALPPISIQATEQGRNRKLSFRWAAVQILLPVTQRALILTVKSNCRMVRGVQSQVAS